jgi:galactonate dehydratase
MKLTNIKIYTLDAFRTNWAFIKVETDEGLYGWGEATLGTQEMSLEGCVADYKRLIVGRDPLEVERMLFEVYRDSYWKGGPVMMSALAGIEIACWDIAGKFRGVPVYALLGGKMRDRVKMYANAWFVGAREPADFAAAAKKVKAFLTVELNMGQMNEDVRLAVECSRKVAMCNRVGGMIPSADEVLEAIRKEAK